MEFFRNNLNYKLAYDLFVPTTLPAPVVVFSHGFDSSKNSPRSVPIAEELLNEGIASFLFDYTGHGDSEGTKEESTIPEQTSDLKSALSHLTTLPELDLSRIGLHGSSSGCLPALYQAIENEKITTLVLRAPRTDNFYPDLLFKSTEIKAPILIVQGEFDPLLAQTKKFFKVLKTEKELKVIRGADHLFSNRAHFLEVIRLTVEWFVNKLALKAA